MATTASMRSFNDVMSKANTPKFISLRLEVRTYVKSSLSEWYIGIRYKERQLVKISDPIERHFRCLEEHVSSIDNNPTINNDLWMEIEVTDYNNNNFTTAGINYGDWLRDSSLEIKQSDIDTSSSINYNSGQNVTRNLTLNIKNSIDPITLKGLQNWGADYSSNRQKWWLDKRLAVFVQVRLVNRRDAEYWEMPMGVFIITGLSSSHTLTNHPTTTIQASSAEVLYSSRRGKFNQNITIEKGSTIIDGIRRILIQGGEKPENIMISPNVIDDSDSSYIKEWEDVYYYKVGSYVKIVEYDPLDPKAVLSIRFFKCIEEHESSLISHPTTGTNKNLYWTETVSGNMVHKDYKTVIDVETSNWNIALTSKNVKIEMDRTSYRTKYDSTVFTFNNLDQYASEHLPIKLATYTFKDSLGNIAPINFSQWNTAAFYARSNMDLFDGTFQLWLYNGKKNNGVWQDSGYPFKLNIMELVGNMTQTRINNSNGIVTEETEERENWRMMMIPLGFINELDNIYRMELVLNKPVGKIGYNVFKLWIDDIIVTKINNLLENPLNYTISQNRWQAIKEMADLMLCDAYYTRDGYFLLTKKQLLSPTTYIDNIREYLKWKPGFGPFNPNPNPTINKIAPFNLIETESLFQFEPFYNFRKWLLDGNRSGPANILKISTNNLYSRHLVQPNTCFGDFVIKIGQIYSINKTRATRIINHVGLGTVQGYFEPGIFNFESGNSLTDIPMNQIIKANLLTVLYYNKEHQSGAYNYWALDDLFGLTSEAALIVDDSEFEAVFIIKKEGNYRVPQDPPIITFSDLQEEWRKQTDYTTNLQDKRDGFYAGGNSTFEEGELSNHIITYGGSENDPISGKAEGVLTEDGLVLRVKGKQINERGRVRGINNMDAPAWQLGENYMPTWAPKWLGAQFYFHDTFVKHLDQRTQAYEFFKCLKEHLSDSTKEPIYGEEWTKYWKKSMPGYLLNKDSDIDTLYKGCFNIDIIKEVLGQDKFLFLTQQPISNFTVEKIGDFIYHHNQGNPDSLLKWTWELKTRVIFEFKKRLSYAQKFSFQIKPFYGLDCFDIIKIHDRFLDIVGTGLDSGTGERFKIETINIPLNGNYISITASREFNDNFDVPTFNEAHKFRFGPYFYGIDVIGDNDIDYRLSANTGEQVLHKTKRLNVGGGSNVKPYIKNTDAPDNRFYPDNNYAHFFTQRYPLKHQWGIGWVEDNVEDGITLTKLYKIKPGIGKPTVSYMKGEIVLKFPSKLFQFDGVVFDKNAISAFSSNPSIIKEAIYDSNFYTILLKLNTPIPDQTVISLNKHILFIYQSKDLTTISTFEFKYILAQDIWIMTEEEIDSGVIMPGNPGKVPGYTIEDIQRHMGYSTDEMWYPNPPFGEGGSDWKNNIYYNYGTVVRIPAVRKWSTLESYIFMQCIIPHLSTLTNMPKFNKETNQPESSDYWQFFSTEGIPWVIGQPVNITYDFYDVSFFEGEMSLEKGYAANPVTNGEAIWKFLGSEDDDLLYSYRWMYKNGKLIYAKGLQTGFSNKNMLTTPFEPKVQTSMNNIDTSFDAQFNSLLSKQTRDIEAKFYDNNGLVTVEAPYINGYTLDQEQNMFTYKPDDTPEYNIKYKKEPKGTIVVKHIWFLNGKEIEIIQKQVFSYIYQKIVKPLISLNWIRLTTEDNYSIVIDEEGQIKEFKFEYEPIPEWTINNNFHNLAIDSVLLNENGMPIVSNEKSVYISNINNLCWTDGKKTYIIGTPRLRLDYVIFGKYGNVQNSLASISILYKNGIFGHFFTPDKLSNIKYYEQQYEYIELNEVTKICSFIFKHSDPKDILVI